jgi:putative iron-regulated protein
MHKVFTRQRLFALPLYFIYLGYSACTTAQALPTDSELNSVGERYLELASASFGAALEEALIMQQAIEAFLDQPDLETLGAAKSAWSLARKPYAEIEAFRFGNLIIDDWEPQLNAWPLDEGFIDYVDQGSYFYELGNPVGQANLIANTSLSYGPQVLDLTDLSADLLASLNELGGTEANVATGWHAIEFLLWGQDLNGTGPGAGNRPVADFALTEAECSNGNCDRRRQYLSAVTDLLIEDLEWGVSQWDAEIATNYQKEFAALPAKEQLRRILFGVGSLSLGELAGERMKVSLYANSPEDEHDCFSDNTHFTLLHDQIGIANVLQGQTGFAAPLTRGISVVELLEQYDADLAQELGNALNNSTEVIAKIAASAEAGIAFDQLIAPGNSEGAAMIQDAIDALFLQTRAIEAAAVALGLNSLAANTEGHF